MQVKKRTRSDGISYAILSVHLGTIRHGQQHKEKRLMTIISKKNYNVKVNCCPMPLLLDSDGILRTPSACRYLCVKSVDFVDMVYGWSSVWPGMHGIHKKFYVPQSHPQRDHIKIHLHLYLYQKRLSTIQKSTTWHYVILAVWCIKKEMMGHASGALFFLFWIGSL